MKAKHVVAAGAAVLLLGLATTPLWYAAPELAPPASKTVTAELAARERAPDAGAPYEPAARTPVVDAISSEEPPPLPAAGSIAVEVIWSDDKSPVGAATVMCREQNGPATFATTDAAGVARFAELEAGGYFVSSTAMLTRQARVEPGRESTVQLLLHRGFRVRGQVVDPSSAPVPGAEIFVIHQGMWPSWTFPRGRADANGRFEIDGVVENQAIGARDRHWGVAMSQVCLPDPNDAAKPRDVVLRFEQAGSSAVRGRVVDPQNRPVANAWVQVHRRAFLHVGRDGGIQAPVPGSLTRTDNNGEFVAEWLGAGEHDLYVYGRGFAPHARKVELVLYEPFHVEVQLAPGARITGSVRDTAGNAVVGAMIRSLRQQAPQEIARYIGPDGGFEFEDLPPGECEFEVVHKDYGKLGHTAVVSGTETLRWDAVLTTGDAIAGRLLDHTGQPLVNWFIQRPKSARYARTDDEGRFTLPDCKPEDNTLLVRPDSVFTPLRMSFASVAPAAGEQTFVVPADTAPSARLRGRCIDASGAPLAEVAIHLFQGGQQVHNKTVTNGDGTFEIGPLPPGKYRVLPRNKTHAFKPAEIELTPHAVVDLPTMPGSGQR